MTLTALITEREGEVENASEMSMELTLGAERYVSVSDAKKFLRESITAAYKLGLEKAKGCVGENPQPLNEGYEGLKDVVYGWVACREATLKNLEEALEEQAL